MKMLWRLSNFLAHKEAWYLVGDLRTRTHDELVALGGSYARMSKIQG
jgi:hypothetical protein